MSMFWYNIVYEEGEKKAMKRTVEEEAERNRNKTKRIYHSSDDYAVNQAWKEFKSKKESQVVELSILELTQRLTAILGGKQ